MEQRSKARIALLSGLTTAACLIGPPLAALLLAIAINGSTGFMAGDQTEDRPLLGIAILLGWMAISGLWGRTLARLAGTGREGRMTAIGALTFLPAIFLAYALGSLIFDTSIIRGMDFERLPTYRQYPWVFVPSAFIVAGMSAFLLSVVAANWRAALRNAGLTGLISALVFWLVVIVMDAIGYRVGAIRPGLQPALPPMPFVTFTGTFFGALVGGGLLGALLSLRTKPEVVEVSMVQTAEA